MRIKPSALFLPVIVFFLFSCGESNTVLLQKANQALLENDTASAQKIYQHIFDRSPETIAAVEGLLKTAAIASATNEQIKWSNELLKFRPWHRQANLIVGKSMMDEGNLKDAAIRLILAYQNSTFQNEKQEVQDLLQEIAWLAQEQAVPAVEPENTPEQEKENDSTQTPPGVQ